MRYGRIVGIAGIAVTAGFLVVAGVAAPAGGAAPAPRHTLSATAQVVVRPVSSSAKVTPGYQVTNESNSTLDCTSPSASPAAVDPDILACGPDSEYAVACWLSRTPHRTLCLRDVRKKKLVSIKRSGVMAQTLPYVTRGPLALTLGDGTYCTIRDGGAGAELHSHPNYGAYYYCQNNQSIWAPMNAKNWGIDRSQAVWTTRTASSSGNGSLRTRNVAKVWFVGMHS